MPPPEGGWIDRALGLGRDVSPVVGVILILFLLADSWGIVYAIGGAGRVAPHFFYVPILFAAVRFGLVGALATSFASTIIGGPLLPLDAATGTPQMASDWLSRGAFFFVIGGVFAGMVSSVNHSWSRQVQAAERERELATYKADLLQTFSHELRTPLTVIVGTVRTLEARKFISEEAKPLVEALVRATNRLQEMITLTLATVGSKDRRRKHDSFELKQILDSVCKSLTEMNASERVKVEESPDVRLTTDPEVLTVVLRCVIDNALKFSPTASPVLVRNKRQSDAVEILVIDRGPGIKRSFIPKAFEAFTQADPSTKREHGGLGLGLYAARKLAQDIGGEVDLASTSEEGTEVVVRIPQKRESDRVSQV